MLIKMINYTLYLLLFISFVALLLFSGGMYWVFFAFYWLQDKFKALPRWGKITIVGVIIAICYRYASNLWERRKNNICKVII